MIYKFYGGPEDGREENIPEMPTGAFFKVAIMPVPSFSAMTPGSEIPLSSFQVATYVVTEIGDLTFKDR